MTVASILRLLQRINRTTSPLWLCSAALLGIGASDARADFIGYYAPSNFTLTNTGGGFTTIDGVDVSTANGSALFPNLLTLVLTGTMDGSAVPGYTDLTIPAYTSGMFQFNYVFTAHAYDPPVFADPQTQFAGFLVGGNFSFLADEEGALNASGFMSVPVTAGELIGFRVGGDNQGGIPGVLTITNFSAPVPEPGTFQLLLIAAALGAGGVYRHRRRARRL